MSGPATRRILEREVELYGRQEYAQLAAISVAHLYNLRRSQRYRERRLNYIKTRPTTVSIGERRKPEPRGQPGYLRLDTVHQGDTAEAKGVYHINAVDEVTQWQVAGGRFEIGQSAFARCWIVGWLEFSALNAHYGFDYFAHIRSGREQAGHLS